MCPTQNCQIKKKNSLNIRVIHEKQNKLSLLEHNLEHNTTYLLLVDRCTYFKHHSSAQCSPTFNLFLCIWTIWVGMGSNKGSCLSSAAWAMEPKPRESPCGCRPDKCEDLLSHPQLGSPEPKFTALPQASYTISGLLELRHLMGTRLRVRMETPSPCITH